MVADQGICAPVGERETPATKRTADPCAAQIHFADDLARTQLKIVLYLDTVCGETWENAAMEIEGGYRRPVESGRFGERAVDEAQANEASTGPKVERTDDPCSRQTHVPGISFPDRQQLAEQLGGNPPPVGPQPPQIRYLALASGPTDEFHDVAGLLQPSLANHHRTLWRPSWMVA